MGYIHTVALFIADRVAVARVLRNMFARCAGFDRGILPPSRKSAVYSGGREIVGV